MKKLIIPLFIAFFSLTAAFSQTKTKVATVGNSITQGPGRDNPDSYPLQMQKILGDEYDVKNFGVSGRTLLKKGDFPYWNEPQFKEVMEFEPDIVVIMLGTNDSKPQNWEHKAEFKQDYIDLINAFKKSMPDDGEVYVVIPVPVTKENYGIRESVMMEMRPVLKEIASETGSKMIDLHAPFKGYEALLPDGVHPNVEGLGIMAREIAKAIK